MKKLAMIALALFGAALVLGIAACSNSAGGSSGGGNNGNSGENTTTTPTTQPESGGEQGGGSSGTNAPAIYSIVISNSIQNGTVTTSKASAAADESVTLTATPNAGYEFCSWDVRAADGTTVSVANKAFIMPAQNVAVSATFVKAAPTGFVTVEGSTVVGSIKFRDANHNLGVFVAGRSVAISTFWICDHEVTQAEYQAVMGTNPSNFKDSPAAGETQENRPVETVTWYAAITYCNKKSLAERLEPCYTINGKTNPVEWGTVPTSSDATWDAAICDFTKNGYRLPTEAEWEYAARGGKAGCEAADPTEYAGTDSISKLGTYAWYDGNSGDNGTSTNKKTHEVKTKTKNSLGLYDMTGNVNEWCWDWFGSIDASTPAAGASSGTYRVVRGGSWWIGAYYSSVALRNYGVPNYRDDKHDHGFRVVRSAN